VNAPLTSEAVAQSLAHWQYGPSPHVGHEIECVSATGSTNDDLLMAGTGGAPSGLVRFAEQQTRGRGRRGDAWVSPAGSNLLFSVLLRPAANISQWSRLPLIAGVALCRALERLLSPAVLDSARLRLKWPNDLLAGNRKLAGILVESRVGAREGFVVLGVGMNVNLPASAWPEPLCDEVTSLQDINGGRSFSRPELAGAVLAELDRWYPAGLNDAVFSTVLQDFRQRCALRGKRITAQSGDSLHSGVVADIGPLGELLVDLDTGGRVAMVTADRVRLV